MRRAALLIAAMMAFLARDACAQDVIKIGFIAPTTGQFAQIGNHLVAGAKYYMQEHGAIVDAIRRFVPTTVSR